MSGTSFRDASRIASGLTEIEANLAGIDRFQARLGECGRYWAKFLDPVRDALQNRVVALFTKEPTMQPVAPHSLPILNVAGYTAADLGHGIDHPGEGPDLGKVFEIVRELPEALASQVVLELQQRLPRHRQVEIAALLGA